MARDDREADSPGVQQLPPDLLDRIVVFLRSICLQVVIAPVPVGTLLPGIAICRGVLHCDPQGLTWPGDLLHEAGHLAVTPAPLRAAVDGDTMIDAPHAGEAEATAWAYAATCELGLDPSVLFHAGGYHGKGGQLAFTYAAGCYPGAAGLIAAGMCDPPHAPAGGYPRMRRWLRE